MRLVVPEWQRVLRYRDGRFVTLLEPGVHSVGRWRAHHVRVDLRPWLLTVPSQDVLTSDGLTVKVSLLATLRVAEPRAWHESSADPKAFVYAALQIALRDAVAVRTLDELVPSRAALGTAIGEAVAATAHSTGVAVDSVAVRDVMLPAELRRAAAEVATARAAGQAALERARSEVAANRALLNAAKLVADHPALLQLRTLQVVETSGAVVHLASGNNGGRADRAD